MQSVGLVACKQFTNLTKDDSLLMEELQRRKVNVAAIVWDDTNVDWSSFSLLIIRCPWYV